MINIAKLKYYFRWYPFECESDEPQWWYNRCTGEVVHRDEINVRSYCQRAEQLEYTMLPVPMINIVEMEKEFLTMHGYTRIKNEMQQDTRHDFDYQFKCFIDYNGLTRTWHLFEGEKLQAVAITWCKDNGIRFATE